MLTLPTPSTRALLSGRSAASLPTPASLLMCNRVNQMGFGGITGSDGVDTDSNTRISLWNETGTGVTRLRLVFCNWFANLTNEQDAYNAISVTASIEYPAGTFQPVTFSGSVAVSIANGATLVSDEVVLAAPIPADAQFWVRSYVVVAAGQRWPQGYTQTTTRGETFDFSTGVDKTLGGTITNTSGSTRRGFGPAAVRATGFTGAPRKMAFASLGDSILMAVGDGNFDARGSTGWQGRAFSGRFPHVNIAISGTQAQFNLPASLTRRLGLMQAAGVTHVLCDYGNNDAGSVRTFAQTQADLTSIWTALNNQGLKVVQCTLTPRTNTRSVTVVSLTASGTTITVSAPGHGLTGGQVVRIFGATPSQYNPINDVPIVVIDANTFTYVVGTAPGTSPATVAGSCSTDFNTTADQTIYTTNGGFVGSPGSVGSRRSQLNDWIRTKPAPLWDWFDMTEAVETARDSGIWRTDPSWGVPRYTGDGTHPSLGNVSPEQGSIFVMRDALITGKLNGYVAL